MALLTSAGFLLVALAGCYGPALSECAVTCSQAGDCGPGQVCSGSGWCTKPGQTGACGAAPMDAAASDAGSGDKLASLRLELEGAGSIEASAPIDQICTSRSAGRLQCTYVALAGTRITLRARDGGGWRFSGWSSPSCDGEQSKTCALTLAAGSTAVGAMFILRSDLAQDRARVE